MEANSLQLLTGVLASFVPALRSAYAAGVLAPTIPSARRYELDIAVASLLLKRTLNDLRAAWVLVSRGYTSQCASVVAAMFENGLATCCVAGNMANAEAVIARQTTGLPWGAQKLAQLAARAKRERALDRGEEYSRDAEAETSINLYRTYKWLAKVKHPTLASVIHDALSTALDSDEWVIMAAPDVRPSDTPVKALVLTIAVRRALDATEGFVSGAHPDTDSPSYRDYSHQFDMAHDAVAKAFESLGNGPLPFDAT